MRKVLFISSFLALLTGSTFAATPAFYNVALDSAKTQLNRLATSLGTNYGKFPRTINGTTVVTVNYSDWTSGFFPGSLWLMYKYTNDPAWKDRARKWTDSLPKAATVSDHDVGFRIFCSYGTGLEFQTPQQRALDSAVIVLAAKTLAGRYSATVKAIKSWDEFWKDGVRYTYPVIIDNMMNLELLCWATSATSDSSFLRTAIGHANTTIKNHFHSNFCSYHVLTYDPATGAVLKKATAQGYADTSAWARGQAWGLYGYTMMYRITKDTNYLNQARNIGKYIISRLSTDNVPYWDYDAPATASTPRDASAAAICASAYIELSGFTSGTESQTFYNKAKAILQTLASSSYTAKPNTNGNFILMHCTGHKPAGTEIDVPLNYADYYYLEALLRLKKHEETSVLTPQSAFASDNGCRLTTTPRAGSKSFLLSLENAKGPAVFSVVDTRGCTVARLAAANGRATLDCAKLPAGCYVVKAMAKVGGAALGTAKIVTR
jgi:unsaturated chondroitin disaccharide hydrolase